MQYRENHAPDSFPIRPPPFACAFGYKQETLVTVYLTWHHWTCSNTVNARVNFAHYVFIAFEKQGTIGTIEDVKQLPH